MLMNALRIVAVGCISALLYFFFVSSRLRNKESIPSFLLPFGRKSEKNRGEKVSRTFDVLIIEEVILVLLVFLLGGRTFWLATLMSLVGAFCVLGTDIGLSFSKAATPVITSQGTIQLNLSYVRKRLIADTLLATASGFLSGFVCYILSHAVV